MGASGAALVGTEHRGAQIGARADMIVALTNSDEVNMIACQIAWTLFRTPTKIARIRSSDYHQRPELFGDAAIPVDLAISPEQLVTDYVENDGMPAQVDRRPQPRR